MIESLVEETVRAQVCLALLQIEESENVRIVYACESGSRAWGFPSADSDYDVRFIYVRPKDWYLSVFEKRDVIERPLDEGLDVSGWDIRKALQLMRKSNPPLLEWLVSPIVYKEASEIVERLRALAAKFYSPVSCRYHYLSMANGNFRDYLKGPEVSPKKYFYVLRPPLAIRWIDSGLGAPPTEFQKLVDRSEAPAPVVEAINQLIEQKRQGAEMDKGPRIEAISSFVEDELARLETAKVEFEVAQPSGELLDETFRWSVKQVWA